MKKILTIIILISLTAPTFAASKVTCGRSWVLLGIKTEKLIGQGPGKNTFNYGPGLSFEIGGFQPPYEFGIAFGTGLYKTTNHVGKNKISSTFYTPIYLDFRPFQRKIGRFIHSLSIGISWNVMFLERMETPESHMLISFGIVEQLPISDTRVLQFMLKPYVNVFNDLEQYFGVEFNLAWGSLSNKTQKSRN